mgnify:CR=1 FL=1
MSEESLVASKDKSGTRVVAISLPSVIDKCFFFPRTKYKFWISNYFEDKIQIWAVASNNRWFGILQLKIYLFFFFLQNAVSLAGIDGNSTKEITLVPATTGGKIKRKLHGERKKKKNRRKTHKQGKSKNRNQTPNRKHKHRGKKFYKRRSYSKHARKFSRVVCKFDKGRGKYTQLKQVITKRNGNKQKHIKKKSTLMKCKDDIDCPSKSCCVQQHHGNNKFCRRVSKRRCSSPYAGKKTPGRKLFQKMKNRMKRIHAKNFEFKGAKEKFLKKILKEIELIKKKLREKFPGHKIYGHEP